MRDRDEYNRRRRERYAENSDKMRLYAREQYRKNPERQKQATKKWLADNPDKAALYLEQRYRKNRANRDEYNERQRLWRQRNTGRQREYLKRYDAKNPEKQLASTHTYRAKTKGSSGFLGGDDIKALRAYWDGCCAYCGESKTLTIEHVVNFDRGGTSNLGNIVLACRSCNLRKRGGDLLEWWPYGRDKLDVFMTRRALFITRGLL